jgi:hypothetical protein
MMECSERTRYRAAIFGLLTALIFTLTGFAISAAVVDAGNGATNVCYNTKNGKLRTAVTPCKAGKETARTLGGPNQLPQSYSGSAVGGVSPANNLNFDSGAPTSVVRTGTVPAGTYAINGTASIRNIAIFANRAECRVQSSTGNVGSPYMRLYLAPSNAGASIQVVSVTGRVTTTAPSTLSLNCYDADMTQQQFFEAASITATRVKL